MIVYGKGDHYFVEKRKNVYICNGTEFTDLNEAIKFCDDLNKSVTRSIENDRYMGRKYND